MYKAGPGYMYKSRSKTPCSVSGYNYELILSVCSKWENKVFRSKQEILKQILNSLRERLMNIYRGKLQYHNFYECEGILGMLGQIYEFHLTFQEGTMLYLK